MSRIGKAPITIPGGVTVDTKMDVVSVKGPKGTLSMPIRPEVRLVVEGTEAKVELTGTGAARQARALHGLTRALVFNMVEGVTKGFTKNLEIVGVGWNAKAAGKKVVLNIGFCHSVDVDMPEGVTCETPAPTKIILVGFRQTGRWSSRRRYPRRASAGALQRQRHPLRRRIRPPQGRQELRVLS